MEPIASHTDELFDQLAREKRMRTLYVGEDIPYESYSAEEAELADVPLAWKLIIKAEALDEIADEFDTVVSDSVSVFRLRDRANELRDAAIEKTIQGEKGNAD